MLSDLDPEISGLKCHASFSICYVVFGMLFNFFESC